MELWFLRSVRPTAMAAAASILLASPALAKPAVTLTSPKAGETYNSRTYLDVEGIVRDSRGLKSIEIYLNGRPLARHGQRNIEFRERVLPRLMQLQGVTEYPLRLRIPVRVLKKDRNTLTLRSVNVVGEIVNQRRVFTYRPAKGTVFVAAIGINSYRRGSIPSLKYAEKDATAVAAYFRDRVGVPRENVFTLIGREATAKNIKKLLGVTLQRKAGPDDQVIIYYAGHGVPEFDKSATDRDRVEKYLLPWDGEIDALYATAIPMREIDYLSQRLGSKRVVFLLDTCFSGAAGNGGTGVRTVASRMSARRSVRLDDGFLGRMANASGKVILTASGINELSQEQDSLGHGVFTYYLLEGMKGSADFDADGIVSVNEIHKYVSTRVPQRTGQEQRPTFFVNETVTGDIVLGRSSNAAFKGDFGDPWEGAKNLGRLVVQTSPPNASIFIDGFARGTGFINTLLGAGRHRLRIERPGYRAREKWIAISRHELSKLTMTLRERQTNAPPPP